MSSKTVRINWKMLIMVGSIVVGCAGFVWKVSAAWTVLENGRITDSTQMAGIADRLDSLCVINRKQFMWDTAQSIGQGHLDQNQTDAIIRIETKLDKHLEAP